MARLEPEMRDEEYHEGNDLVVRAEIPVLDPDYDVDIYVLSLHAERKETPSATAATAPRSATGVAVDGRFHSPAARATRM